MVWKNTNYRIFKSEVNLFPSTSSMLKLPSTWQEGKVEKVFEQRPQKSYNK